MGAVASAAVPSVSDALSKALHDDSDVRSMLLCHRPAGRECCVLTMWREATERQLPETFAGGRRDRQNRAGKQCLHAHFLCEARVFVAASLQT